MKERRAVPVGVRESRAASQRFLEVGDSEPGGEEGCEKYFKGSVNCSPQ